MIHLEICGVMNTTITITATDGISSSVQVKSIFSELTVGFPIPDFPKLLFVYIAEWLIATAARVHNSIGIDNCRKPSVITGYVPVKYFSVKLFTKNIFEIVYIMADTPGFKK